MAYENKKMTAPNLSAATDREQPTSYNNIIPDSGENDNPFEDGWHGHRIKLSKDYKDCESTTAGEMETDVE